jgi:hypothetical protein
LPFLIASLIGLIKKHHMASKAGSYRHASTGTLSEEIGWYTFEEIDWYTMKEIKWYTLREIRQEGQRAAYSDKRRVAEPWKEWK